jgi:hypothetical protein
MSVHQRRWPARQSRGAEQTGQVCMGICWQECEEKKKQVNRIQKSTECNHTRSLPNESLKTKFSKNKKTKKTKKLKN